MKSTILILFFSMFALGMSSQESRLSGVVRDSTGIPLENVSVLIPDTHWSSLTDAKGVWSITPVSGGSYTLVVTLLGHETLTRSITIKQGEELRMDFVLKRHSHTLREVEVSGIRVVHGMGHLDEVHDGIIYSGKKTEVLLPDSMDANTAQNNPRQVLGRIPGANYSETEGGGFPSNGIGFRGLNPTQSIETNTRQNGYNVSADLYGYPESYYLPPLEAVERIEVVRGASALQFGPQFGGMINYILKSGNPNKAFEYSTEQTGGSYGFFNSFQAIGGTVKKWNYYVYAQLKTQDGWRIHSDLKQAQGFAKLEYKASETFRTSLEYSILRNRIHMPGGLSDEQFVADSHASFRARNWLTSPWNILTWSTVWAITPSTTLTFKSALNISSRNLVWKNEDGGPERPDSISSLTHTYVQREVQREAFQSSTNELRLLTTYNLGGQPDMLSYGLRYFAGTMKRQGGGPGSTGSNFDLGLYGGTYEYDLNFMTYNLAGFVENTFHLGKRISLTPGFRYEYLISKANGYVTDPVLNVPVTTIRSQARVIPLGGLGLQMQTSDNTNLYANCSQAYRPTDYANQTPIGVSSKIDPNLKDAQGYNADLGWRGSIRNYFNFDIGAFYMLYNNRIGLVTLNDAAGNPYTYRTNVANSLHKGLESYAEFRPMKLKKYCSRFGCLSLFNSLALIDAQYTSGIFTGKAVEFAPSLIERAGISYMRNGFSTTFSISYTAQSFSDANNTVYSPDATVGVIPAYTIMDWSATWRIKKYHLKFGMNNLADKRYFTLRTDEYPGPGIIPSAGRSFYVGAGATF
ncbi:MAG TPA: TonB-dependent receptor [Bacteroidia bacterium]|jgi:Fe(3+) dicitrate transport protein|nr:TonB-dependent receptor [Bacteroidia bacterium]